ncbi:hypothetical protein OESDEN_06295 [Oesophagostomum dentatum]|uniref:Secreted protein n=1 Tax=Oesophagostomum dentatum TaxID=61180 RepID=A0A0B1T971_OESDE|nr:hypothetical protein OESDEN_06295 [Oesophagostomum dentatum]
MHLSFVYFLMIALFTSTRVASWQTMPPSRWTRFTTPYRPSTFVTVSHQTRPPRPHAPLPGPNRGYYRGYNRGYSNYRRFF